MMRSRHARRAAIDCPSQHLCLNQAATRTFAYWAGTPNATHGTPNDEDAHVPLLFWGRGVRAGHYDEFARVVDIAPTLAHVLGIPPLERLDGHVLSRALR